MMLYDELKAARIDAMKQKMTRDKECLTVLIGDLQTDEKNGKVIDDAYVIAKIKKYRQNAIEMYDLTGMQKYEYEEILLENFLPKQMTPVEIQTLVVSLGEEADLGSIMKHFKANFAGQYDAKLVSEIAREQIALRG